MHKKRQDPDEKKCPVVTAGSVPKVVIDSFMHRYPSDSVRVWFNKDGIGYCAFFISSGIEKLAQFSNSGNFVKEDIETEDDNEHENGEVAGKSNTGCECEVHSHND